MSKYIMFSLISARYQDHVKFVQKYSSAHLYTNIEEPTSLNENFVQTLSMGIKPMYAQ